MNRHISPLPRLLVVASLVLLTACPKEPDDTTGNPPPPAPIAAEQFAEEYASALCARQQRCNNLAPYLVDQCKTQAAELIGATDVSKAMTAGRLTYDADRARACVDGMLNTSCLSADFSDEVLAACYAALHGTVERGAACSFTYECAAGLCQLSDEGTCPGTCPTAEQVVGVGEACSNFRNPKCDVRAGLRCSGGTCVRPADQGASCIDNSGCKSGLLCIYKDDSAETGTCLPLAKQGSGCSGDAECEPGLFCTGDSICAPRVAEGKPCALAPDDVDAALRGAECQEGLTCKGGGLDNEGNPVAGTCAKVSAEGGACQATPENTQLFLTGCQSGLDCTNGTCALPPVSGTCPQSGCRFGVAFCDGETNTCQLLRQFGEACTIPPQCASRNCGPEGTCIEAEVLYCHETPPPPPPPSTTVAAEKFSEEYANALCTRQQRCNNLAPYLVDQCKADAAESIGATDVPKAIAAGRITYDAKKARACVDGMLSTSCLSADFSDEVLAACYAALHGTVERGTACSFTYECAVGLCQPSGDGTCPGTCPAAEQVVGVGEACSTFRNPKCDVRAGLRCSGGTCVQPANQGASCIDNNGCKSGLLCIYANGADAGTCTPLAQEGSSCSDDASCAAGLFCTGNNVCAPRLAEGKPCGFAPDDVDAALRGAECQEGLTCKGGGLDNEGNPIAGTCAQVSAEGGACKANPGNTQLFLTGCQEGLACNNGTCALLPVSGPCASETDCRTGVAHCNTDTNTCQLLKQMGEACTIPPECASRNCGPEGTCIAPEVLYCHE